MILGLIPKRPLAAFFCRKIGDPLTQFRINARVYHTRDVRQFRLPLDASDQFKTGSNSKISESGLGFLLIIGVGLVVTCVGEGMH